MTDPLEGLKHRIPDKRHQQDSLRADRHDPNPPRHVPELPVEPPADDRQRKLQSDHDEHGRGSLPA